MNHPIYVADTGHKLPKIPELNFDDDDDDAEDDDVKVAVL